MTLTFDTLLIANRGEIACRIIRSARALGLRTVAVYSDADAGARHVRDADVAVRLGPAAPNRSYLDIDAVVSAAVSTGAGAVHPGYGFLSENVEFAARLDKLGITFVGPTVEQLRVFADKHTARQAAEAVGVPLVEGSGLLQDVDDARRWAQQIGYPVMLKAVGGGGGIGLQVCHGPDEVGVAFDRVSRLAGENFSSQGVFLERYVSHARHIEVQVFGDGLGDIVTLGTRDCSLQRRNQKVIEEAPAPALPAEVEHMLVSTSRALAASVGYRSAGTVEFVYDVERGQASFLEMNTRLQVEHPVTEAVTGVDLVAWMLRVAGGDTGFVSTLAADPPAVTGHAVEARVYAEDPAHEHRPCPGQITDVVYGCGVRVDDWIEAGTDVSSNYDPMLSKVIAHGHDRVQALNRLGDGLFHTAIHGVTTNLGQLRAAIVARDFLDATHTTTTLAEVTGTDGRIDVLRPGVSTTLQDLPGRVGLWNVGIPPSGPMDDRSFAAANLLVGNSAGLAALEATLQGPALRFHTPTSIAVTGAPATVLLDGLPQPMWKAFTVPAGGVVEVSGPVDAGVRTYLAVAGGFDAPTYLGSSSTFALGGFGGFAGRVLRSGDCLSVNPRAATPSENEGLEPTHPIDVTHTWEIAVTPGPQASADYFTAADLEQLYAHRWRVGGHANRTGIRLEGPKPSWSRTDGGDAGLHPSNLHDNPYSVGALNISGDTPILLGPDGPSLGGFVCPVTVISAHRWKLGQLRPGDTVAFVPVTDTEATSLRQDRLGRAPASLLTTGSRSCADDGLLSRTPASDSTPEVRYQRAGDDNILVEYGEMELDLGLRMRVHALSEALSGAAAIDTAAAGVIDITPGVRSLHLHFDPEVTDGRRLVGLLTELESEIGATRELSVPSRQLRLPLSFDDPSIAEALDRYRHGIRDQAPWLPSNIEFIRRINGLDTTDQVRDTMFDAEYLVLGLGDVYLGAPLAVPLDPRHRLMTTKYNPARTWTPSDAVGIGGKYLCVYGMESPGGYQLVGRTLPIWSTHRHTPPFAPNTPWLFRYFDRIIWEPVGAEELLDIRAAARAGRYCPEIVDGTFTLTEHLDFLKTHAADIEKVERGRRSAFEVERQAWIEAGEFDIATTEDRSDYSEPTMVEVPDGATLVTAAVVGNVWRVEARPGDDVADGATLAVMEAMKLELPVTAPHGGRVLSVLVEPGQPIEHGAPIAVIGAA